MTPARFWRFVARRQGVWAHRHAGGPPVADAVLARARFTNVFRALDRGTLFAAYELLPIQDRADCVWSVLMYRAVNRIDAFVSLIGKRRTAFRPDAFVSAARTWRDAGRKVFTGVYMSSATLHGKAWRGAGLPMDRRLAAYGVELRAAASRLAGVWAIDGLDAARDALRGATRRTTLGPFTVNQAALDLDTAYFFGGHGLIGPGARKGLALLGLGPTDDDLDALTASQPAIEGAPLWRATGAPVRLGPNDVEHALCEWQKYERIAAGGHAKGVYRPAAPDEWAPPAPVPPWWTTSKGDK